MLNLFKFVLFALFLTTTASFNAANAQLYAPNRNWAAATQYIASNDQDSVFVFFPGNSPSLFAKFSDSAPSTYTWYKYNDNLPVISRFQLMVSENEATLVVPEVGGYKVEVKRDGDESIETYIAWVMIDNVSVNSISLISNRCESLELRIFTTPSFYEIPSLFSYNDLSLPAHQEKSILGAASYFANHKFESLNPQVEVLQNVVSLPFIFVEYENVLNGKTYGPLFDAEYKFTVTTPFGRGNLVVETDVITAIATKVDMEISFFQKNEWKQQPVGQLEIPKGEALLEIQLVSNALNADSIFWNIINDTERFKKTGDSILWSQNALFSINKFYPPKQLMRPGYYKIEHVASTITNGTMCRDTLIQNIEVDASFLKPDGIPNVFSPNNDGENDLFIIKGLDPTDPTNEAADEFVMSIRSFSITILSRWGKPVYKFSGDPKKWEGWNGKIDGTRADASEGVYYYIIDAVGWDGVRYRNGQYKGFLHLFR
jgi:hypothetical protein